MSISFSDHLSHPFNIPDSKSQMPNRRLNLPISNTTKAIIGIASIIIGLPTLVVGGVMAFYLLSYLAKKNAIQKLDPSKLDSKSKKIHKTSSRIFFRNEFTKLLNSAERKDGSPFVLRDAAKTIALKAYDRTLRTPGLTHQHLNQAFAGELDPLVEHRLNGKLPSVGKISGAEAFHIKSAFRICFHPEHNQTHSFTSGAHFRGGLLKPITGLDDPCGIRSSLTDLSKMPSPSSNNSKEKNLAIQKRYETRDKTMQRVIYGDNADKHPQISSDEYAKTVTQLCSDLTKIQDLPADIQKKIKATMSEVYLFIKKPRANTTYQGVLNNRDVLLTPTVCDRNAKYEYRQGNKNPFFQLSAAAVNIGESGLSSEDFADYSQNGKLDLDEFIKGTGEILNHILAVADRMVKSNQQGKKHVIMFPFGMGAFLKHVADPAYTQNSFEMHELRNRMAKEFVAQFRKFPYLHIHFCLPADTNIAPTLDTHNAIVQAINDEAAKDPAFKQQLTLYVNNDAAEVAQEIANKNGPFTSAVVNGANKHFIGNRWFGSGSFFAIDEYLHRISSTAAFIAALCNGDTRNHGQGHVHRLSDGLKKRISFFSGNDHVIEW